MKPYYEHAGITIYHGDCREILPVLGQCADLLVTDPPYGIGYDASHSKYKGGIDRGPAVWDVDAFDPTHLIALQMPSVIWGGNCFSARLPDSATWLCWVKTARNGADVRQSDMELAWCNCIGRGQVFRHLWIGAYRESESGLRNEHPTQKPEAVMRWSIKVARTTMNEPSVLDPYMGSGTTLKAAKDLGRRAIGIEIEERYCEIAALRLSQEVLDFGRRA